MVSYAVNPTRDHLRHAHHILCYLLGTQNYRLKYEQKSGCELIGYVNADWDRDLDDRKLTSRYVIKLTNGAISWVSHKQSRVANSTVKAEYIYLHKGATPLMWYRNMFKELSYNVDAIAACINNNGAAFNTQNPTMNKHVQHMDIRYHWVRKLVEQKELAIYTIDGIDNPADIFTKILPPITFQKHIKNINLEFLNSENGPVP